MSSGKRSATIFDGNLSQQFKEIGGLIPNARRDLSELLGVSQDV